MDLRDTFRAAPVFSQEDVQLIFERAMKDFVFGPNGRGPKGEPLISANCLEGRVGYFAEEVLFDARLYGDPGWVDE